MIIHIPKRGKDPAVDLYVDYIPCNESDEDPVIFLPGGPGFDHQKYKHDHQNLIGKRSLVFWDPRGCGKSGDVDFSTYDMGTYVEDVYDICQHLGLKRVIVIGVSYGAVAAQQLVLSYPDLVSKLLLVVGVQSHRFAQKARRNLNERGNARQIEMGTKVIDGKLILEDEFKEFLKVLGPLYSQKIARGEKVEPAPMGYNREVLSHGWKTYLKTFDFSSKLNQITCPTLILAGERDWICDPSESELMAQKIPHSKLCIFKDAGHFLALDAKEEYHKEIFNFLEDHELSTQ